AYAARYVAQRVALAGRLLDLGAAVERDGASGVVAQEVDRLGDVGVGLGPRLGALAHAQRGELVTARAHPLGGALERGGALGGGCGRPRARGAAGDVERAVDVVL